MLAMGEVVNLKRLRKIKARTQAEAEAAANRLTHGRAKAEKHLTKAEQEAAARKLDGHKHDGQHNERSQSGSPRSQRSGDDE
jgi:Domain of unknown function (DUF4169)